MLKKPKQGHDFYFMWSKLMGCTIYLIDNEKDDKHLQNIRSVKMDGNTDLEVKEPHMKPLLRNRGLHDQPSVKKTDK